MAILFADDKSYITCSKGHKTFTEQNEYAYRQETGRLGTVTKRKMTGKLLCCTVCGEKQRFDLKQKVEDEA